MKNFFRLLGVVLSGLAFFAFGAGMGAVTLHTLWKAGQMRGWDEVPARVEACGLESQSSGSDGGATYSVSATYRYTVDGQEHTGQRVGLHAGSDNVGTFQQDAYAVLENARASGATVPCRVNPANPDDAVLFWDPRVEMLGFYQVFAYVFGGAGLLVLFFGAFAGGGNTPENGRVRMEGTNTHKVFAVVAAVFALYAVALVWVASPILKFAEIPWWGCLPFAVTGIFIALAVYFWSRFKKFGVSVLELSPCPAEAGRMLRGTVHIPRALEAGLEMRATLRHVHQYTSGSGKRRSTHKRELWKDAKSATVYLAGGEMSVARVEWELPPGLVSTARRNRNGDWWELELNAKTRGVGYKAVFAVEVGQANP
ncbi:MAG: DUF3592 domain-containing protein [Kiritimatiellaeota bacterium]|nr:DUF3592 domain-containing protein [Kiritimatiellota bacterium]